MLKWLRRRVWFSFQHISSILSGCCDCLECGTREWILLLRMRHPILPNTNRPVWSMRRMMTIPNIDVCQSINLTVSRAAISSPLQWLQDPVNRHVIHIICPAMMNNTDRLAMWLKRHLHEVITQHAYWLLQGSIWIPRPKRQRTGGTSPQITMITNPTQWRLALQFDYLTSPTGGANKRKRTQSKLISPMWPSTYSPSYYMVSEWSPVFSLAVMLSAGCSQQPQARPFANKSL